ncbi:MAG: flagellar basal body-associated FliL family protein [Gammaproteobacteria bacterium]|nr:flagellar basal body-associated FliL family protein [Gammaproteobacteria bacterium]
MTKQSLSIILSLILLCCNTSLFAADGDEEVKVESKPSYVSLGKKPMVLNLATDSNRLTFLQVQADVLVKNDEAKEIVEANIPAIRHKLIVLLSEQKAIDMKTPATREEIRKKATTAIRDMIEQMTNNTGIEEILFSNFLVQ